MHNFDSDYVDPDAMEMKRKTPLAKALDSMSYIPFIRLLTGVPDNVALTVAGVDAGTLYNPKIDVILEKSTESSFGRGSETVLDPSYRRGREIRGADIDLKDIQYYLLEDVEKYMFPGREVELKLYKLAVYDVGGHFDWHMDSTHSDKHHGTLLLALDTPWEGGNLMLRRNGIETSVDLRPQHSREWKNLRAVAFFTDTEHRVEPVKSGIRIVLQYHIELSKKSEDEGKTKAGNERDEKADEAEGEDDEGEEEVGGSDYRPWMDNLGQRYSERRVAQAKADKAALEKVLSSIKGLHDKGTKEVAFALQHLYRSASVSAEYLMPPYTTRF